MFGVTMNNKNTYASFVMEDKFDDMQSVYKIFETFFSFLNFNKDF